EIYAGTEGPSTMITGEEWLRKPGSVGRVSRDAVTILGEAGRLCAPGEVGEIFFAPDAVERFHYIGADRRTDESGRMSLGDLGYLDEEDYLFLSDRRTDLVLRGGANIYPAEVEAALIEHPSVIDAVVIGLPCDELGARVHAIVRLADGVSTEALDSFVRGRIAGYKCPASYEVTDTDLRDDAGKVRRSALRDERLA
ncbi:MAG: AMP-binding enzyme, partial [Sphingopyxis sp.]